MAVFFMIELIYRKGVHFMGFISAVMSAAGGTLSDQWKEYFYCDALPADVICRKASRKSKGFGNRGNDNVITEGSVIVVADGQCAVVVEQGQVIDICAEPGEYRFDSTAQPCIFTGSLSEGIQKTFAEVGRRITFGGSPSTDQRIYYFNTKELTGLKYGTASPVPFRVLDARAGIDMDIRIKAFGEYSIRVTNPILFYTNVCANQAHDYTVSQIEGQLRSELLTALQPAFAAISEQGIRYSQLPAHTQELTELLNDQLSKKWKDLRGIEIVSFGMNSIKADAEDEKIIRDMQKDAAYVNPALGAAALTGAQAQAMRDAANNTAGAMTGFMGMNAAMNAGGVNANTLYQQAAASRTGWTCPTCGSVNQGNFCSSCGTKNPALVSWKCPKCGAVNEGNFCSSCGEKRPQ